MENWTDPFSSLMSIFSSTHQMSEEAIIVEELASATKLAFRQLFEEKREQFYFCGLVTHDCEGCPFTVAWSEEALERFLIKNKIPKHLSDEYKWSYAESPYIRFGHENFSKVESLLSKRPSIFNPNLTMDEVEKVFKSNLNIFESAILFLDKERFFGDGLERSKIIATVVVSDDDDLNVEIAKRLNPPEALTDYLNSGWW